MCEAVCASWVWGYLRLLLYKQQALFAYGIWNWPSLTMYLFWVVTCTTHDLLTLLPYICKGWHQNFEHDKYTTFSSSNLRILITSFQLMRARKQHHYLMIVQWGITPHFQHQDKWSFTPPRTKSLTTVSSWQPVPPRLLKNGHEKQGSPQNTGMRLHLPLDQAQR